MTVYLANRGVWHGGWSAGPAVSVVHMASDVDPYVQLFNEFLRELLA